MSGRLASGLSGALFGASVLLLACATVLSLQRVENEAFGVAGLETLVAPLAIGGIGAMVAARRCHNPIGWLLLAAGVVAAVQGFAEQYAIYGLATRPGAVPWPGAFAWAAETAAMAYLSLLAAALTLFPTGHPLSRRWSIVLWAVGAANLLFVVGSIELWPRRDTMIQINTVEPFTLGYTLRVLGTGGVLASAATAATSLILRFRRARGDERAQIKWVAYAAAVAILATPTAFGLNIVIGLPSDAVDIISWLPVLGLPIGMAVAVLKYRLYDIDRLISRTLSYALLSALLAVVYSAVVLLLGIVLGDLTAQTPSWVVACATLAAAALFQPARRRIQQIVDRRFNRRRYDAATTIAIFGNHLRDHTDPNPLAAELLDVIDKTMQPAMSSLWLPPHR